MDTGGVSGGVSEIKITQRKGNTLYHTNITPHHTTDINKPYRLFRLQTMSIIQQSYQQKDKHNELEVNCMFENIVAQC